MTRLVAQSLLVAALLLGLSAPALAADHGFAADDGIVAAGTDRHDAGRTARDGQIGPDDDTVNVRNTARDDRREERNGRTVYNRGVYRIQAAGDGSNWSWLGLMGLIGLAGLARGDNRNRNRT